MSCPLLIFSQSGYLIQIVDINSHTEWQTVQIQISWLLQKPTDLDLHCLQRQGISGLSRTRINCYLCTFLPDTDNCPSWVSRREKMFHDHPQKTCCTLRKHAYSNTLIILQPKKENFQIEKFYIFHIPAQNIDCGHSLEPPQRGGSNKYPQSMLFSKIRKIICTPVNPSFTI